MSGLIDPIGYAEPLPLHYSWPLFDLRDRMACAVPDLCDGEALAAEGIGLWHCDLADNSLHWTQGVYQLFGIAPGTSVARDHAVSLYTGPSREAMEALRAYALRHRRGFTLHIDIDGADGVRRRARLTAAPLVAGGAVVGLRGVKQVLSGRMTASRASEAAVF